MHNLSREWLHIKEAAEKARDAAISEGDEVSELTCSELLEALELSRCLLLMKYIYMILCHYRISIFPITCCIVVHCAKHFIPYFLINDAQLITKSD